MTRERRANLVFLLVFVIVALPGLFVLLRKKADPTIKPMGGPENVRRHLVFIDPVAAPPGMPRMMPALTSVWLNQIARGHLGARRVMTRDEAGQGAPIMSEQRLAQLVDVRTDGHDVLYSIVVWNVPRGAQDVSVTAASARGEPLTIEKSELIGVPASIKQDLELSGLPAPPQQVLAVLARSRSIDSALASITLKADARELKDRFSKERVQALNSSTTPG